MEICPNCRVAQANQIPPLVCGLIGLTIRRDVHGNFVRPRKCPISNLTDNNCNVREGKNVPAQVVQVLGKKATVIRKAL